MTASKQAWPSIDDLWLAVSLGELSARDGVLAVLDRVHAALAIPCTIESSDGVVMLASRGAAKADSSPPEITSRLQAFAASQGSAALVIHGRRPPPDLRFTRILTRLWGADQAAGELARCRHEVNNGLAVVLANLELLSDLAGTPDPRQPLLEAATVEDRATYLHGFELALSGTREVIARVEQLLAAKVERSSSD